MALRHNSLRPHVGGADAPAVVYGLPSRTRRAARARQLIQAGIWLLGVAGFLGPLIAARTSPHADLLRALALGWFILFGVINGLFVFRAFPRHRFRRDAGDDR